MKKCSKCKKEKSLDEFHKDRRKRDGRVPRCKICVSEILAEWNLLNKDKKAKYYQEYRIANKKKIKERVRLRHINRTKLIGEIKHERGCRDCRENNPCCLQFHHRDPTQKLFTIGKKKSGGWDKILQEIEKCDVICANCHLKYHNGVYYV